MALLQPLPNSKSDFGIVAAQPHPKFDCVSVAAMPKSKSGYVIVAAKAHTPDLTWLQQSPNQIFDPGIVAAKHILSLTMALLQPNTTPKSDIVAAEPKLKV